MLKTHRESRGDIKKIALKRDINLHRRGKIHRNCDILQGIGIRKLDKKGV